MKDGTCPRCQAKTVYAQRNGIYSGRGSPYVKTGAMNAASPVDSYLCTTCGYYENYVVDPPKLAEVARLWKHIASTADRPG
jgi:hypothetical protein